MKYAIIEEKNISYFIRECDYMIHSGWIPLGGVNVTLNPLTRERIYTQSFARYSKDVKIS